MAGAVRSGVHIDGSWIEGGARPSIPIEDPSTGKPHAEVSAATVADVDAAVTSARRALEEGPWVDMTGFDRRRVLSAFAREVAAAAQPIGDVTTADMGMPRNLTVAAALAAADHLEHMAGWADKLGGETLPTPVPGALDYTIRHPVGVVAAIVPWNAPVYLAVTKIAPALAAGCTVVLKPSELAPLGPMALADCATQAGLPPGVLNVVTGAGEVGAALVAHPGIDKVSYTGGGDVGRIVATEAARRFKRCTLELGGKSANIVFADADLDAAGNAAAAAVLLNTGQQCIAGSRLLVQRPVHDELVDRVVTAASAWTVGDPRDPATMMGPLITGRHLERVLGYVDEASSAGRVVLGGERLGGDLADGYFLGPTVVADVDPASRLCREEVFGPVISTLPFDTVEEAIAIANDTPFGLAGGVWTSDLDTAHTVAGSIRAGAVWVNTYAALTPSTPFGGHKESGIGREGGRAAVEEHTELTNVLVALRDPR